MTNTAHTPTPWESALGTGYKIRIRAPRMDSMEIVIADEVYGKENAAFIVRACNGHEALLSATILLREQLSLYVSNEEQSPEDRAALDAAEHAITLATKE